MRESIGGAQVLIISVSILLIMIIVLAASIGYTKAFKARNAIVNIVEKNAKYGYSADKILINGAEGEIDSILGSLGYKVNVGKYVDCPDLVLNSSTQVQLDKAKGSNYNYCIYHIQEVGSKYEFYRIKTNMYFELPVFGRNDRFSFSIYGDTYMIRPYGNDKLYY